MRCNQIAQTAGINLHRMCSLGLRSLSVKVFRSQSSMSKNDLQAICFSSVALTTKSVERESEVENVCDYY